MSFTIHAINMMLNYEFRNIPFNGFGSSLYAGLSLSEIDNYGNGVLEPNDINYQRVAIPRNYTRDNNAWGDYLNNEKKLKIGLAFTKSDREWGNIIELFISTSGDTGSDNSTVLYHQKINPLTYIGSNTTFIIPANSIAIESR